jgi:sugar phosphate permease
MSAEAFAPHSSSFRTRRFWNWFPLGLAYAMLYMGRYNLTVAKTALGSLITKEDFGIIFAAGTIVYAVAFFVNGPLIDRIGGRKGALISLAGSCVANLAIGAYVHMLLTQGAAIAPVYVLSLLYAVNMYFQSFGAVSIVKVNAAWFHVRERGGFSGIFGTMISSGLYFAFSGNQELLVFAGNRYPGEPVQSVVFFVPALFLAVLFVVEFFLLRDRPSQAGHQDFDAGDGMTADDDKDMSAWAFLRRMATNPVLLTIAAVEFCTGVVRNGVMQWFPIYAKEIWVLADTHPLRIQWGLILFVAGVIGANTTGWISDIFFKSRRAPVAFALYAVMTAGIFGMVATLAMPSTEVATTKAGSGLREHDQVIAIAGKPVEGWEDVARAVACVEPVCVKSTWNAHECSCTSWKGSEGSAGAPSAGTISATLERDGTRIDVELKDPKPTQRAGDKRALEAQPLLPLSPYALGFIVFLMSLCVIGTHGLLSGTATMDFAGKKHAAKAVGFIDGAVYAGTAVQSLSLGFLTTLDWALWPWFMLPFGILGCAGLLRIWHARPRGA